ncbi:MAG: hypothetical protein CL609_15375 [Anaerolineaceae bacterium]|nr:hypothetical protein [Anaerolineaceae bacterium]
MKHTIFSRFTSHSLQLALIIILLVSALLLTGCGASTTNNDQIEMASMSSMPAEVQNAPSIVREAYQFAVANPEALKNVPCYCGCNAVGHTSNYSCYVKEVKETGEIIFDQHALGCSICVDIAQDVIKMTKDGKTPSEIRTIIDSTYAQFGPSNMPPVQ